MEQLQVATQASPTLDSSSKLPVDPSKSAKAPVVRGARACTVCRAAKMKCVGAEDGQPCQRCKRQGSECVFEKHRRGRKPGSKLSEASKMLRRLEKGLNSAKLKSQTNESVSLPFPPERAPDRFPNNELPPLNLPPDYESSPTGAHTTRDDDDDEQEKSDEGMFPAKLIQKEQRNSSFFKTILNPEPYEPTGSRPNSERSYTLDPPRVKTPVPAANQTQDVSPATTPSGPRDPIQAGIIDESHAAVLFDLFFLRLNPFINLFDPALHTVTYIRSRCPFLFSAIIMACCKFFDPENYKQVKQLAQDFAVKAFADNWKRVEVCQAFACMTYWKEPEDTRTWTYIGYACRMAVELGLNRYVGKRPSDESDLHVLERRNRERTYLVLFVHDRSLSTQTGRQWMLPECELVRHSTSWHEEGGSPIRPEDVILAAFVQLRRIASETTDLFHSQRGIGTHVDMNYDVLLRNCNHKLTQWAETWENEMKRANGEKFHFAFLSFFRLYVRLFLNSFGIQSSMSSATRTSPSLQALSACYTSALDNLQIVTREFASISMLRYSQETIGVMTAYSAVFLLKLLRSSNTLAQLHEGATEEIYTHISKTADAYQEASSLSPASSSLAAHHARFLKSLITRDIFRAKQSEKERFQQQQSLRANEMRSQPSYGAPTHGHSHSSHYGSSQMMTGQSEQSQHGYHFPASPNVPAPPPPNVSSHMSYSQSHSRDMDYQSSDSPTRGSAMSNYGAYGGPPQPMPSQLSGSSIPPQQQMQGSYQTAQPSESDANYWRNMFRELGFGDGNMEGDMPGYAASMPDGPMSAGSITSSSGSSAYHEPRTPSHSNGHNIHGGYQTHPNRHYQPYPAPSYNSHAPHASYGGHLAR